MEHFKSKEKEDVDFVNIAIHWNLFSMINVEDCIGYVTRFWEKIFLKKKKKEKKIIF